MNQEHLVSIAQQLSFDFVVVKHIIRPDKGQIFLI